MFDMSHLKRIEPMGQLAPEAMAGFTALGQAALAEGAIPEKYKESMAIAVALTTQCRKVELELPKSALPSANGSLLHIVTFPPAKTATSFSDQRCGGYDHDGARQGIGASKNPGKYGGSGIHRDRGHPPNRLCRQRASTGDDFSHSAWWPVWTARGNRSGRSVSRLGRCSMADGRENQQIRRRALRPATRFRRWPIRNLTAFDTSVIELQAL